jgi:hypothetical protein
MIKLRELETMLQSKGYHLSIETYPLFDEEKRFVGTGATYFLDGDIIINAKNVHGIDVNDASTPNGAHCEAVEITSSPIKLQERFRDTAEEIAFSFYSWTKQTGDYLQYTVSGPVLGEAFLSALRGIRAAHSKLKGIIDYKED